LFIKHNSRKLSEARALRQGGITLKATRGIDGDLANELMNFCRQHAVAFAAEGDSWDKVVGKG